MLWGRRIHQRQLDRDHRPHLASPSTALACAGVCGGPFCTQQHSLPQSSLLHSSPRCHLPRAASIRTAGTQFPYWDPHGTSPAGRCLTRRLFFFASHSLDSSPCSTCIPKELGASQRIRRNPLWTSVCRAALGHMCVSMGERLRPGSEVHLKLGWVGGVLASKCSC